MDKKESEKLLQLFEELAEKFNINIVHGKGDFVGGMCSVNDEKFVVLNKIKPLNQRLNILGNEFSKFNLENVFVSPMLREKRRVSSNIGRRLSLKP